VLLNIDGTSDFDGIRSYRHNDEVQFAMGLTTSGPCPYAKPTWSSLLAPRPDSITVAPLERDEIGPSRSPPHN
jgi:hypothetical protein